jgi:gliding motility-associated-like protein
VHTLPVINAGPTAVIGAGTTTTLSGSGAVSYVWSPPGSLSSSTVSNPTSSASASTTYTLTGTDINGCSSTDTVSVIVHSLPTASAGAPVSICNGNSTTLSASGGGTYSWTPTSGLSNPLISNPVASPTSTTTYSVSVTNASGCTASSSVLVTVNPTPTATVSLDVIICNGASTVLTAGGGGTYSWSPAAGLSSTTSATPTATPSATTSYTVTVSNGFCSNTASVLVTVNNVLSMATASTTNATCGDADGSLTAGAVTGGSAPFTYSLNGGPVQTSSTFTGLASGSYTLTVIDGAGCTSTQTVVVNSILGVNASFTANPTAGVSPLTVNLTNTSTGASNYIWDFDNGTSSALTNPSVTYNQNGSYTIILVAYNGSLACSDTAEITITVYDQAAMIVPNIFTPNGDGHNDMFVVQSVGLKELSGTIFNRWGRKVTEWSGAPTEGWNGKINGKDADDGTYYYIIKATGYDDKEYTQTGFVQLLNN